MKTLSRLNGWQRIGFSLSAAWLILISSYAAFMPRSTDGLIASKVFHSHYQLTMHQLLAAKNERQKYGSSIALNMLAPTQSQKEELNKSLSRLKTEDPNLYAWLTTPADENDPDNWIECTAAFDLPSHCPRKIVSIDWLGLAAALLLPVVFGWLVSYILIVTTRWIRSGFART
jgi:hypothetical protein